MSCDQPSRASATSASPMASSSSQDGHADSVSGSLNGRGETDKGPLSSMNLGFLKSLAEKKTTRGKIACAEAHSGRAGGETDYCIDGQPTKRRGPKPDSKPALTRRQELNRQAQRYGSWLLSDTVKRLIRFKGLTEREKSST